jgi:predicted O-linked N-acetylglucosamine transferase (SPINDLY family)
MLIEDVNIPEMNSSKGRYSLPFLHQNGFHLKRFDYQTLLQRNCGSKSISPENQFLQANEKFERGDYQGAIQLYEDLLIQRPGNVSILTNLTAAYFQVNKIIDSRNMLCQLVEHSPKNGHTWNNLGKMYRETGQIELALDCFQKALSLLDNMDTIASNRLFTLNYAHKLTPNQIANEHFQWGASKKKQYEKYWFPQKKLIRIAYVSPDFSTHAVSFFIKPILRYHDKTRFKVFCYANVAKPDNVTYEFQAMDLEWRDIYGLSDTSVMAKIKKDEIDILIDLAGHTRNNRLSLFALKPAPVQLTYLGYPNTTGLQAIDYRLTDTIADPPASQKFYTEKLLYLKPCFLCYEPQNFTPKPERKNSEKIRFCSFNNIGKMNKHVIQTWSLLLKKMPQAQLFLKSRVLADDKMQQFVRNCFQKFGVQPYQLEFSGFIYDHTAHLESYHNVDIALDSFPYNGTTTTLESLWMGVPVITLEGNTHASRVGKSILTSLGLTDFIASNESDYITKAIHLAKNKSLLNSLRNLLRQRLIKSQLLNPQAFVRQLENIYDEILMKNIIIRPVNE